MYSRRQFLSTLSVTSGLVMFDLRGLIRSRFRAGYFGLNEFIENNPDAVFVLRTNVDSKTNSTAIKDVGRQLGVSLFQIKPDANSGFPTSASVALKPNITWWSWDQPPIENVMGIHTDPNFVEGIVGRLTELSIPAGNISICEANYHGPDSIDGKLYAEMANRTNVGLKNVSAGIGLIDESDVHWVDVPDGLWFKTIPYLWPTNSSNSCLINLAKLKSHSMGMTLCAKNIQGAMARPYVMHCTGWNTEMAGVDSKHIVPGAFAAIKDNYTRHKNAGIPRWDLPGESSGGLWMETWASRCLDNNSVLKPLINIVEGVYGREGAFVTGPYDGYGKDILTNVILFGKNSFHVDVIGTYLAGHEPGNFGLFHMAKERKLSKYLNPSEIPLYTWKLDGTATRSVLGEFSRTPIRTPYLQKAGEEQYHLVNEPYNYTSAVSEPASRLNRPDVFAIQQNFPNPFNPSTSIQFHIPKAGFVLIEIFDVRGSRVAVLVNDHLHAGNHLTVWRTQNTPSGTYYYRMSFQGSAITRAMVLLR
ncbi:MAG TPA: hypothetical protein DEP53_00925 [Bacteroidetes bacterium]|nr:MAG: hypothetical protein A2X66_02775 [Ignavibacteria bacterium GWA2_54_16]HCA78274.1 hypothetical protein [Bacteroidota bacterium]